jgi:hypothetical protein
MKACALSTAEILLVTRTLKEMRNAPESPAHLRELDRLYRKFERATNVTLDCDFSTVSATNSRYQAGAR